jgi:microsomal dipeptidase-like Zn-dependent dipeptidase
VFRPIAEPAGPLGGALQEGEGRGLTALGRAVLDRLATLAGATGGPHAIVDLAGMGTRTRADVLDWIEDGGGLEGCKLGAIHSHFSRFDNHPDALGEAELARMRALGVVIGLTPGGPGLADLPALDAAVDRLACMPWLGQAGPAGIALGTAFPRPGVPGLARASDLVDWARKAHPAAAESLLHDAAARVLLSAAGAQPS